jgi:hypothetical protein
MRHHIGSRVHYRVYPSGLPAAHTAGTVVAVDPHPTKRARLTYTVQWDDVDPVRFAPTPGYMASDLARAHDDAMAAGR